MSTYIQRMGDIIVRRDDEGGTGLYLPTNGDLYILKQEKPPEPDPPPTPPPSTKRFVWPFDPRPFSQGGTVSSEYGPRNGRVHQGIDFGYGAATAGGSIIAAANGRIRYTQNSGFGFHAIIDHGDQLFTVSAHMPFNARRFPDGAEVRQGQQIGVVGNTGNSYGAHLHWETHVGGLRWSNPGSHMNPREFMQRYG